MRLMNVGPLRFAPVCALCFVASACGSSENVDVAGGDAGTSGSNPAMAFGDPAGEGACKARQQSLVTPPKNHVPVGTVVDYVTNPPCGGPHFPIWAAFQEYDNPVDRRYYVHAEEHGGVVLAYKCANKAACPQLADQLRAIRDALPQDALCTDFGVKTRIVITPDPLLDRPIGVAAWGFSYTADCVDAANINAFITAHYDHGVERLCNPGMKF